MDNKINNFPKLLVITVNAWSDKIASGNTISNYLGGWDKSKLSNIYLRNEEIDNECCTSYFKIDEKEILTSLFSKKELGVQIEKKEFKSHSNHKEKRKSTVKNYLIRIRPTLILILREIYWKIGFRKKKKLNNFLKIIAPDVIHVHCSSLLYAHRTLHYCHKVTNAKVVVFFGDENYSYKSYWPLSFLYQFFLRHWIRKTIAISSINYAATQELSDYYSAISGKNFKVLHKGVSVLNPTPRKYFKPIKIVYAGNLLYGRWQTLSLISKAIDEISKHENEFELSIYTGTSLSKEMLRNLNSKNASVFDAVSFTKVKSVLNKADLVLHVESFDKKNIAITKYSFSTKITDCIQSANCIMGVGPSELASINFLKKSKGAIVANSYEDIVQELKKISSDHELINSYRYKMFDFSKDIFDLNIIRNRFYNDIFELK